MKKSIIHYMRLGAVLLILTPALSINTGCKHAKKAVASNSNAERDRLAKEKAEADRLKREQEEKERAKKEPYMKLENYFNQVANAGSVEEAGKTMNEALNMFSSPDAPLLIIIHKSGEAKDYDRPTTIKKYFEYLKDQKKNMNAIEDLVFDENGKIKEVTLIKK